MLRKTREARTRNLSCATPCGRPGRRRTELPAQTDSPGKPDLAWSVLCRAPPLESPPRESPPREHRHAAHRQVTPHERRGDWPWALGPHTDETETRSELRDSRGPRRSQPSVSPHSRGPHPNRDGPPRRESGRGAHRAGAHALNRGNGSPRASPWAQLGIGRARAETRTEPPGQGRGRTPSRPQGTPGAPQAGTEGPVPAAC